MKKYLIVLILAVFFSACNEYQKALKTEDAIMKVDVATKMYESGKYSKAIRLFEQLAPLYKGKPQAEKIFYMYSQSLYKTNQFYLAGYQFESFVSSYPRSEKNEEASFKGAKSYFYLSPAYTLDQKETYEAIDKLQTFIDKYPSSTYLLEANELMKTLREKIERKAFENAKIYNTISNYKAAIVALDNFINDYPGTPFKEQALFYKLDSAFKLAINSIPEKMEERLQNAQIAYNNLIKFKKDTQYKERADKMLVSIEKDLKQFSK